MKKILILLFFVFTATFCHAQCRIFIGEPLDSLNGIIRMVERYSGYHLSTIDDLTDSTRINFSYDVIKKERGSQGNSLVNVSASYNYKDKIIAGDVVRVRTNMRSLTISAPTDVMCLVLEEFRKNISKCIVRDGGTFIHFGAKEKPYRAIVNIKCGSDALFGSLQILTF